MATPLITPVVAQAMAQHVLTSINQLQRIKRVGVPVKRLAQINDLIDDSQTYLVFLEEVADDRTERARSQTAPLLEDIRAHCANVNDAFKHMITDTK